MKLVHRELTQAVIDAFYEVYNELGSGFLPSVYQRAMAVALRPSGLSVKVDHAVDVMFMGESVGTIETQLAVEDVVLVAVQCLHEIEEGHVEPVRNRLKATHADIGLLLNFGPKPAFKRVVAPSSNRGAQGSKTPNRDCSTELKHASLTEQIIGAFFSVYNSLGVGFAESIYENAMQIALRRWGVACVTQQPLDVEFRGERVGDFRADVIVENKVLVELKCAKAITDPHIAQALNYMKAATLEVGLVLNFGTTASFKRLVLDR